MKYFLLLSLGLICSLKAMHHDDDITGFYEKWQKVNKAFSERVIALLNNGDKNEREKLFAEMDKSKKEQAEEFEKLKEKIAQRYKK